MTRKDFRTRELPKNNPPSCLFSCQFSALREQLHSTAIRLLPRLENEPKSCVNIGRLFFSGSLNKILPVLFFLSSLLPSATWAWDEEILVGQIISLDQTELLLAPAQGKRQKHFAKDRPVLVHLPACRQKHEKWRYRPPNFLREKNIVRIWGHWGVPPANSRKIFFASRVRSANCGSDPTGVRHRIGRGCRHPGPERFPHQPFPQDHHSKDEQTPPHADHSTGESGE